MGSIYIMACMCYKRPVFFTRHTLLIVLGPLWNNETVRELGTNLLQFSYNATIFIHFRSMSDKHFGLKTLEKCQDQVTTTIRNNLDKIAQFLREKDIIDRIQCREITNPDQPRGKDYRARMVWQGLVDKVEEDDDIYKIFVEHIRRGYSDSGAEKTVAKLDEQYEEIKRQDMIRSGST